MGKRGRIANCFFKWNGVCSVGSVKRSQGCGAGDALPGMAGIILYVAVIAL